MHDEVTKHTRKIYNEVKNPKHSFGDKIREILIEILIIVFAVTISIWLHNWSEHRHQQKEVKEFLADLKDDLSDDIQSMKGARDTISNNRVNFLFIQNLTQKQNDSLDKAGAYTNLNARIATTIINIGNYEGFKSSGKIGYIEDKNLKKMILKYYQQMAPFLTEMDKTNTAYTYKIYDFITENADEKNPSKILLNPKLKMIISMSTVQMKMSCQMYDIAIKYANEIITQIDKHKIK